jgi:hypothetical protein
MIHGAAGARPMDRFTPPLWGSWALYLQTLHLGEALEASGSYILRMARAAIVSVLAVLFLPTLIALMALVYLNGPGGQGVL